MTVSYEYTFVTYREFMQPGLLNPSKQWETNSFISAENLTSKSNLSELLCGIPDAVGSSTGGFHQVPIENSKVHQWLIFIPLYFYPTGYKINRSVTK